MTTDDLATYRAQIAAMTDKQVIAQYEAEEGIGPRADVAADEMERRNLDF